MTTKEARRLSNAESQLQLLAIKSRFPHTLPREVRVNNLETLDDILDDLWPLKGGPRAKTLFDLPEPHVLFGMPIIVDESVPKDGFGLIGHDGTLHWYFSKAWL